MAKRFEADAERLDPYKNYRFLMYFGNSTTPVAGVSKISSLKRTTDPILYNEGGDAITHKGIGRTKYEPITADRGVTHDPEFEEWANAAQEMEKGFARTSIKKLRRMVRIELCNEAGQPAIRYIVHRAWVSEYQALGDLDAAGNTVILEHIKIEHEGWERDKSLAEPAPI